MDREFYRTFGLVPDGQVGNDASTILEGRRAASVIRFGGARRVRGMRPEPFPAARNSAVRAVGDCGTPHGSIYGLRRGLIASGGDSAVDGMAGGADTTSGTSADTGFDVWSDAQSDADVQNQDDAGPAGDDTSDASETSDAALRLPTRGSIVALSYPDVFRAAARDDLQYDVWRWLSDDLPPLYWYRQWDRCERLSLGLVERFARSDWSLQDFLSAARDPDALRQALEVGRDRGSPLFSRLRNELDRGGLSATPDQRRVVESRRR